MAGLGHCCCVCFFFRCSKKGLCCSCGVWASPCSVFSCCRAWALGCLGFISCIMWAQQLPLPGSQSTGSVVVAHGFSCFEACGIFPDRGSNLCLLHWQMDSLPLSHEESPKNFFNEKKYEDHAVTDAKIVNLHTFK